MIRYFYPEKNTSRLSTGANWQWYEEEDCMSSTESARLSHNKFSRTLLLVLDYKQFMAARRIQTLWRGYIAKQQFDKRWKAAITIQRWWRGFSVRVNFMKFVETKLQRALLDHYNMAARKIQAVFRGWYVRQTIHDVNSLRHVQQHAAEELIACVANKLHHLLRTYSIPGVYSVRNSHCLSKVEKLLVSMTYRFHNDRLFYSNVRQAERIKSKRAQFVKNKFSTEIPYPGPNYNSECVHRVDEVRFFETDLDRRMYKIIEMYEHGNQDKHLKRVRYNVAQRKFRKNVLDVLARKDRARNDFCGDVIHSMRKWKIWDDSSLTIPMHVLEAPNNINQFLKDVSNLLYDMKANCHCKILEHEEIVC